MLATLAEVYHWTHEDMMKMSKRVLFRYYGYWYITQIKRDEEEKERQRQSEREARKQQPRNWQSF
jgi:hypothetical protein